MVSLTEGKRHKKESVSLKTEGQREGREVEEGEREKGRHIEEREKGRGAVGTGGRERGSKEGNRKGKQESQQSTRGLWDNAKCSNTCILIVPGKRKKMWLEKIVEE